MNPLLLALAGTALVVLVMTVLFRIGGRRENYSFVDAGWSANFALLAVLYGLLGAGTPQRRLLVGTLWSIWALRLAWHLWKRIAGHPEEGRYVELRRKWGVDGDAAFRARMFRFFMAQALSNVVLALPLLLAVANPRPQLAGLEWLGAGIWLVGVLGESLADRQLAAFKADPANRGHVCDRGLWRYSRHPNYFFEWTIWVAYATIALAAPWGWLGLLMPAAMLHLLVNVTGVRPTEAQALRSKGDLYRDYQRRTSAFVPLPPRRASGAP